MFSNYLKFSGLVALVSLACFSFIAGCKNAGPVGPYDVPAATSTATNTPTMTPTPGPVNVSCFVIYNGNQSGLSWNLVDPNGNTVNQTTQSTGGTPFSFTPLVYGVYSVNIPTQTNYLYSSQPLTITGSGNYSVTFTCSGQTLSVSPASLTYSSAVGYQIPVTVSYTSGGNLNVPVSVIASGLPSAFVVNPSSAVVTNGGTADISILKNTAYFNTASLSFSAFDFSNNGAGNTVVLNLTRGYTIPVTVTINNNLNVWSNFNGPIYSGQETPAPTPNTAPPAINTVNSDSVCSINFSYDPSVASNQGVTITGHFTPGSDACNSGYGNCSGASFSMNGNSANVSGTFAAGFFASLTTPSDPGTWNFTITGPTGASSNYQFSDNGCNGVGSCSNSSTFMNSLVISY